MRKAVLAALGALCLAAAHPATAQAPRPAGAAGLREFRVDAGHSLVEFSVGFMGGRVKGRFDGLRGTLLYDERAPERSSVTVVIDAGSIDTGSRHRDEHLRSADFFDVERWPAIVFQSRAVRRTAAGLVVSGPLTLHGVTREVSIPFRITRPVTDDPHGTVLVAFEGEVELDRRDFGITGGGTFNPWFDALRAATMGEKVRVTLELAGWNTDFRNVRDPSLLEGLRRLATPADVAAAAARLRRLKAENPAALEGAEWEVGQLGQALLAAGRHADALELLRLNVELFPQSAAALTNLARAHDLAGDRPRALELYDHALALDPLETRAMEWRRLVLE